MVYKRFPDGNAPLRQTLKVIGRALLIVILRLVARIAYEAPQSWKDWSKMLLGSSINVLESNNWYDFTQNIKGYAIRSES